MTSTSSREAPADSVERFVAPAAVGVAFLATAVLGWGRFGDLVVDVGRELDVPRRLLAGERLYADVRWYYGPLAPWLNAGLYRALGVHVSVLAGAGLASAALLTAVVYLLARRFTRPMSAAAAALAFVWLGAFASDRACGFNICNFVLPYSFAATYGMTVAATSLLFLVRHAQGGRAADFGLSCAALALTGLAKLEPLAPILAAHVLFALGGLVERRLRAWPHLVGWSGAAGLVGLTYGALALRVGGGLWTENLHALANAGSSPFITWTMGIDDVPASLLEAGKSAALLGSAIGFAIAAGALAGVAGRLRTVAGSVAGAVAFGLFAWAGPRLAFRALPFAMGAVLLAVAWRWIRGPDRRASLLPHALLWTFALVALARIVLRANLEVYGFYLLPAGFVCLAVLFTEYVPALLEHAGVQRTGYALVSVAVLAGAGAAAFRDALAMFAERTVVVASQRGSLRVPESQASLAAMVGALAQFPPGTRLLSIPEGAGFNYFSGLEAADAFSSHLPMELPTDEADAGLLARLAAAPPELVLVIPRSTAEFGFRGFGVDYARRTGIWLAARYRPLISTGPGVVLLRRAWNR